MKKFWLFANANYVYSSSHGTFKSSHNTLEQAQAAFKLCEIQEQGEIWEVENNEPAVFWDWDSDKQEWTK